ncbi:type II secretion system protein [bacterium]|nr:type II secretion system protein [bacterium]MBR6462958.1 type II secretion system protein [bacterium]
MKRVNTKGFTLIELLVVISVIGILASLGVGAQGPIKEKVGQLQRSAMLRDLYVYLQTYQQDFGSFPSVQPTATRYEQGGGVRDLYPLAYTGRMDEKELNELLHPPGGQFDKFSKEPRPEEFDKNHIGWSYNSTARIDSTDPLLADQGVSSGQLRLQTQDRGIKPLSNKGVMVLLANGRIEKISAHKTSGKLLGGDVVKDWGVLKD